MAYITPQITAEAEWYSLIQQALDASGYHIADNIENYLMLTLNHYTTVNSFTTTVIALDYLQHANLESTHDLVNMRQIGDQSLLLAGLFPQRLSKKNISLDYMKMMGQQAYYLISVVGVSARYDSPLYYALYEHFEKLMRILDQMRRLSLPCCSMNHS